MGNAVSVRKCMATQSLSRLLVDSTSSWKRTREIVDTFRRRERENSLLQLIRIASGPDWGTEKKLRHFLLARQLFERPWVMTTWKLFEVVVIGGSVWSHHEIVLKAVNGQMNRLFIQRDDLLHRKVHQSHEKWALFDNFSPPESWTSMLMLWLVD